MIQGDRAHARKAPVRRVGLRLLRGRPHGGHPHQDASGQSQGLSEVYRDLARAGLQIRVTAQSIAAGTTITQGMKIELTLNPKFDAGQ